MANSSVTGSVQVGPFLRFPGAASAPGSGGAPGARSPMSAPLCPMTRAPGLSQVDPSQHCVCSLSACDHSLRWGPGWAGWGGGCQATCGDLAPCCCQQVSVACLSEGSYSPWALASWGVICVVVAVSWLLKEGLRKRQVERTEPSKSVNMGLKPICFLYLLGDREQAPLWVCGRGTAVPSPTASLRQSDEIA